MIPAAILAGGRSQRLGGGDKCLLPLAGATLLDAILAALAPQVAPVLINSNSDPSVFTRFGLPVRADALPGRLGPLAGILTAMLWAAEDNSSQVLTVPGDTPFLPKDLVARLKASASPDRPVIAASAGRLHPVVGLWPVVLAEPLRADIENGVRAAHEWVSGAAVVEFTTDDGDPFENINTRADLERAQLRWNKAPA
jgi:molybdopterin-guanine dinucleotide biosynthesis protein A